MAVSWGWCAGVDRLRAVSPLSTKMTHMHLALLGLLDLIDYIFNYVVMLFISNGLKMDKRKVQTSN